MSLWIWFYPFLTKANTNPMSFHIELEWQEHEHYWYLWLRADLTSISSIGYARVESLIKGILLSSLTYCWLQEHISWKLHSLTSLKSLFSLNTTMAHAKNKQVCSVSFPFITVTSRSYILISTKDKHLAEDRHLHNEPNKVITRVEK